MSARSRRLAPIAAASLLAASAGWLALRAAPTPPPMQEQAAGDEAFIPFGTYTAEQDAAILEQFEGLRVADVSDGMDAVGLQDVGLVDPAIGPLWRDTDDMAHRAAGVAVTLTPPTGHMGALVLALARYFDETAATATAEPDLVATGARW